MNGMDLINTCLANPIIHSKMDMTRDMFGNVLEVGSILDNKAMKQVLNNNSISITPKLTDFEAAKQILKKSL